MAYLRLLGQSAFQFIFLAFVCQHPTAAQGRDVTVEIAISSYSSLGGSGPALPTTIERRFCTEIERRDMVVWGATLKFDAASWLYPSLGVRFGRQEAREHGGDQKVSAGHTSSSESWVSLDVSSTTRFVWTDFGVEARISRKSGRAFFFGIGGSLLYAKEQTRTGAKFIKHFERWEYYPVWLGAEPPRRVEFLHEETDLDGLSSSGFGLGWHLSAGLAFRLSAKISVTLGTRLDLGTVDLRSDDRLIQDELTFSYGAMYISAALKI